VKDNKYVKRHLSPEKVHSFRKTVYRFYRRHGRDLPWRKTKNPYHIFISEIMLQQTQVERVREKYNRFLTVFPDFSSLARAGLRDILRVWHGLGYNRRALNLVRAAHIVTADLGGNLPVSYEELIKLPGVGRATSSAIRVFAFHRPEVFLETNIRRVFIHFFFGGKTDIDDSEILPLVEETLDRSNPREWYYALMDYGAMLKKEVENPNRRSVHYRRQQPFNDSDRQIRGMILRTLLQEQPLALSDMIRTIRKPSRRVKRIVHQLVGEGFIKEHSGAYSLS